MIEEIFKRMCEIRYFDLEVIKAHKGGHIYCPVYLSAGQEAVAASLSVLCPDYMVFLQHRAHAWYLAYGGDPEKLRDEILGRKIKVIPFPCHNIYEFVCKIVEPIKFKSLEMNDKEVIINAGRQSKAALIGRNKLRLEELNNIVKEYCGKDVRII